VKQKCNTQPNKEGKGFSIYAKKLISNKRKIRKRVDLSSKYLRGDITKTK